MSRGRIGQEAFAFAPDNRGGSSLDELFRLFDWAPMEQHLAEALDNRISFRRFTATRLILALTWDKARVEELAVTSANINNGRAGSHALLDNPGNVYADSAYLGEHFGQAVRAKGGTQLWATANALAECPKGRFTNSSDRCRPHHEAMPQHYLRCLLKGKHCTANRQGLKAITTLPSVHRAESSISSENAIHSTQEHVRAQVS